LTKAEPYSTLSYMSQIPVSTGNHSKRLISFDIDGTMEFGDPPGRISAQWVRQAKELGCLVGSASDRPLAEQQRLWKANGIEGDFFTLKHWLENLKTQFSAEEYWHVGDGQMDELYAVQAGFTFFWPDSFLEAAHIHLNGTHQAP